ncbi:MAG: hypothetical protein Q9186_003287 [Xanthomendoza sp. 1 TL-2023]
MAACLAASARPVHFLIFIALVHSLFQIPIHAASNPSVQTSQHVQTLSHYPTSSSPIDYVLASLRRQYEWAVKSQRMSWGMPQLILLCGIVGILGFRWKNRAMEGHNATVQTSAAVDLQKLDKEVGSTSIRYKGSSADAQATDPGLLRKHSSQRSYTTSFGRYPAIRVFSREHPQADKLPSKPTSLPLLVFIHGLGGSLAQFHRLCTSLVNVAPCLGIDLPGCGLSGFVPTTWTAYTQEALVELLATVIAESCQTNPGQAVVLIGHSMGCSLAALLASADSPLAAERVEVLGLIAICPKAVPPTDRQLTVFRRLLSLPTPLLDLWRRWDRRGGPESTSVARFVGEGADPETKRLQERFNSQSKSAVWRRMAWGLYTDQVKTKGSGGHIAGLEVWAQLSLPIFLIAGESDKITSPDEVIAIARALGKFEQSSSAKSLAPSRELPSDKIERVRTASETPEGVTPVRPNNGDDAESNTQTTILADHRPPLDETFDSTSTLPKRRRVLKTSILPAPAAHSLLYEPTTYRTLAGLIQKFLCDHIDRRLSLGWQLQHLSTEGKWDVKNLVKWKAVRPVSDPVAGVFRAMKTLREIDEAHCPEIFVRNWKGKLKAVVDISYENPVYDPRGLEDGGIEYHKFPTVSKIPPTVDEVEDFIRLIDGIRQTESPTAAADALIGVHCHYGFNRTGFFICSYLIEREHYSVQQAIDEFQAHRPPGIRHDHFLDTLFVRRSGIA